MYLSYSRTSRLEFLGHSVELGEHNEITYCVIVCLSTVLAKEVMQSLPSFCPPVCPSFPTLSSEVRNRLTVDLELLSVSRS